MHIFVSFILLLVPQCSSLPTKGESIRNDIQKINSIAKITLEHIKKLKTEFGISSQIQVTTQAIKGLSGISRDLGLLDNDLQSSFTDLHSQIQADVSSLEGRVRSLASTMNCSVPARPTGKPSDDSFPHSRLYVTLMKVQNYLENLLRSKDKLNVC